MSDAKGEMRSAMRRMRAAMPDRATRSERLWATLIGVFDELFISPPNVLAFCGVGSEPDTRGLLGMLLQRNAVVLLPRVVGEEIVAVRYDPHVPMHLGAHGIPSPDGPTFDASMIDVVIVPGLAFTRDGRRLGQGGGYYDRFLPVLRSDCRTIGVCFDEQLVDDLPSEEHDRRVDRVVTDGYDGTDRCSGNGVTQ
jgi:5-formyltetrahydrofolate cyclo-ligase